MALTLDMGSLNAAFKEFYSPERLQRIERGWPLFWPPPLPQRSLNDLYALPDGEFEKLVRDHFGY